MPKRREVMDVGDRSLFAPKVAQGADETAERDRLDGELLNAIYKFGPSKDLTVWDVRQLFIKINNELISGINNSALKTELNELKSELNDYIKAAHNGDTNSDATKQRLEAIKRHVAAIFNI
jgi:hypothetical protein